jgi:D-alanine-D-alanine ligase
MIAKKSVAKKLRIALLMGGLSSEKEISLESGRHVYNNLDQAKYQITPVFVDQRAKLWHIPENLVWMNTTKDIEANLKKSAQPLFYEDLKQKFDFVFIALHGKYAEEALPGLLEILDLPNNGPSVIGGAISMDKLFQRQLLQAAGLNVPQHQGIHEVDWKKNKQKIIKKLKQEFGFPFIIKPSREGSSTALAKVKNETELDKAAKEAFKYDRTILAEEVLTGTEVTTTVIGINQPVALPPTQTPAKGDFLTAQEKFLPGDAQMITPPQLPRKAIKKIQQAAITTFQALSLKIYTRIDAFWQDSKVIILEPNNPPAMTPSTALFHQAAEHGWTPAQFFDEIVKLSLQAHAQKAGPL